MVKFYIANDGKHKLVAVFDNPEQVIKFGAYGYDDYTILYPRDSKMAEKRKKAYLNRHRAREDWNDPRTAGALSKWILWNKPTIEESIDDYIEHFNMYE